MKREELEIALQDYYLSDKDRPSIRKKILDDNDHSQAVNKQLLDACKDSLDHLDHANFDYSNGNTDPLGMVDEGEYYGTRSHNVVTSKLRAAIRVAEEYQR